MFVQNSIKQRAAVHELSWLFATQNNIIIYYYTHAYKRNTIQYKTHTRTI